MAFKGKLEELPHIRDGTGSALIAETVFLRPAQTLPLLSGRVRAYFFEADRMGWHTLQEKAEMDKFMAQLRNMSEEEREAFIKERNTPPVRAGLGEEDDDSEPLDVGAALAAAAAYMREQNFPAAVQEKAAQAAKLEYVAQ